MSNAWSRVGLVTALVAGGIAVGASSQFVVSAVKSSGERAVYVPITPCRLADTRPGSDNVGPRNTPIGAGESYVIQGRSPSGNCGAGVIPADATALTLNATAVGATRQTNLRFFPNGADLPTVSNLNPSPGAAPTPNAVTTDLNAAGEFVVYNFAGEVHVVIDVAGYFVDHNHDDRYYTKTEVDEVRAGGRLVQDVSIWGMAPIDPAASWARTLTWEHAATVGEECLQFPIEAGAGQRVVSMRVTYTNFSGAGIDLRAQILGFRTSPGAVVGGFPALVHLAADDLQPRPVSGQTTLDSMTAPGEPGDDEIRDGFEYVGRVCTDDAVDVFGARVVLTNS